MLWARILSEAAASADAVDHATEDLLSQLHARRRAAQDAILHAHALTAPDNAGVGMKRVIAEGALSRRGGQLMATRSFANKAPKQLENMSLRPLSAPAGGRRASRMGERESMMKGTQTMGGRGVEGLLATGGARGVEGGEGEGEGEEGEGGEGRENELAGETVGKERRRKPKVGHPVNHTCTCTCTL